MKCKLLVEREVMRSQAWPELIAQCIERDGHTFAPVGAVLEHPDAWRIVMMGQAEPDDDECRARTVQTDEQRAATLHAAARLAAGITQDDYEKFDKGWIVGYNGDGSYKPGPNWAEYEATLTTEDGDDEDGDD